MWQVGGRGQVHTGLLCGDMMVEDHLEDLSTDGRIILKWRLEKQDGMAWTALIWIKKQTSGGGLL
jgi:hypothetical protein